MICKKAFRTLLSLMHHQNWHVILSVCLLHVTCIQRLKQAISITVPNHCEQKPNTTSNILENNTWTSHSWKIPPLVITVLFAIKRNGHSVHWSKSFQNFSVFLDTFHIIQLFCITFKPVKFPWVVGGGAGWYKVHVCVGMCSQFYDTASYERLDSNVQSVLWHCKLWEVR